MTEGSGKGKFYTGDYAGLAMEDVVHLKVLSVCAICKQPKNIYTMMPVIQEQVCGGCKIGWPKWALESNRMFITDKGDK